MDLNLNLILSEHGRTAVKNYEFEITDNECWMWQGAKGRNGYGALGVKTVMGRIQYAHRLMYLLHYGPYDPKAHVLHKCHNPGCCNPEHLELGTHRDNMAAKVSAGRCWRGQGEANPSAKLSAVEVLRIHAQYAVLSREVGVVSAARSLAVVYGVSKTAILAVVNGKTWKHVGAHNG
jgi:hypothetical protein